MYRRLMVGRVRVSCVLGKELGRVVGIKFYFWYIKINFKKGDVGIVIF